MCDHILLDFCSDSPSPNRYQKEDKYGNQSTWEKAPQYTIRDRYKTLPNQILANPPPCAYDPDYRKSSTVQQPNAYSLSNKFQTTMSTTPGPGAYENHTHRDLIKNASPQYSLHNKAGVNSYSNPGPGQYGVIHNTAYFGKEEITHGYSFPKKEKNDLYNGTSGTGAVGPGQYRNEDFRAIKTAPPSYSLHGRPGRSFNEIHANNKFPGPGSYDYKVTTVTDKGNCGFSFGQRVKRGYIRDRIPQ